MHRVEGCRFSEIWAKRFKFMRFHGDSRGRDEGLGFRVDLPGHQVLGAGLLGSRSRGLKDMKRANWKLATDTITTIIIIILCFFFFRHIIIAIITSSLPSSL